MHRSAPLAMHRRRRLLSYKPGSRNNEVAIPRGVPVGDDGRELCSSSRGEQPQPSSQSPT